MTNQLQEFDFDLILEDIVTEIESIEPSGEVANYIPALARVNPDQYAVCVQTVDGAVHCRGCVDTPFSIQSISKVLTTIMVLKEVDILLWNRVGVEPSGNAFDSLVQLEYESGIPRNPFINAGAIAVTDELLVLYDAPKKYLLNGVRGLAHDESVDYDLEVAAASMKRVIETGLLRTT